MFAVIPAENSLFLVRPIRSATLVSESHDDDSPSRLENLFMRRSSLALNDVPSNLVGVSGEYFVAAELSRRGYAASITLRNMRSVDILAANSDATRSVVIQVKTNSKKNKKWIMNKKEETIQSNSLFYVFVNLKGE